MDLTDIYTIKSILRENKIKPNKRLGQNFLADKKVFEKIIETANLSKNDFVVEIGPGIGGLTNFLGDRAGTILAIEKDYQLVTFLRKYFKSRKNIKIVHEDILRFNILDLQNNYKVVANLPYQITSPVIRKFLQDSDKPYAISHKPEMMVLMVQKEVAQRITARPGNSERGFLTVLVEFYAKAEIVDCVDKNSFWPMPEVNSAIIKISYKPYATHSTSSGQVSHKQINPDSFFRLVKAGFSQKRRQIHNPLKANFRISKSEIIDILKKAGIESTKRAEELTMEEWIRLYQIVSDK